MLQRNPFVAPGHQQSRWAESHGGARDRARPRCFCKTAAPEKHPTMLCWTSASPCRWWHPGLWLACHPPQGDSALIHTSTDPTPGAWCQPVAQPGQSTTAPGCPALWTSCFDNAARNSHSPEKATSNTKAPCHGASPAPALLGPWDCRRIPHVSPPGQLLSPWHAGVRKPQTPPVKTVPKQAAVLPFKGG